MKLCPYPFSRMQTSNYDERFSGIHGTFIPCVPSWFTDEYYKLKREDKLEDIWNGFAAQELRRRMYEGDFSFCDRKACQIPLFEVDELSDKDLVFNETPIPPENIEAIKNKNPIMPSDPSSLYLTSDFTCNLNCPICRSEVIPNKGKPSKSAQEEYDYVFKVKNSLEVIKMSNGGEVFYSKLQRKLLKSFNNDDFPKLRRIHIVSNGTMFNKNNYELLHPGTKFIRDVNISLDAATREVYEIVRGKNYDDVIKNIGWLGEMRRDEKIDFLSFHIIIVKDNYKDIPNILKLAHENYVDRVLLQPFLYNDYAAYDFDEQAVHLSTHPEYKEFMDILKKYSEDPLLYSYFDIPGMNTKIEDDVLKGKAFKIYKKGHDMFMKKKYEEALKCFNEALQTYPEYYVYFEMGECYRGLKKYELAVLNYDNAIKIKSGYSDALFGKAIALEQIKDYKNALETALLARDANPKNEHISKFIDRIQKIKVT